MDSVSMQKTDTGAATGVKTAVLPAGRDREELQDQKLRKACAAFESFMVYYMLKTMRKSVPQSGLLGNTAGRDTFNMMLDQKIAEKVSERKGGSLGLQQALYDQLSLNGRNRHGKTGSAAGSGTTAANAKN